MNIIPHRMTSVVDRPIVVFLIGMRVNTWWKVHKWWPVSSAMVRMIKELSANPASGFLHAENWFGRTTLMVQYWESFDALEQYARDRLQAHMPAWQQFNLGSAVGGDVGIWHETYEIAPGRYECIYHNMPPFGLGRVGKLVEATGVYNSARKRLRDAPTR
jgi:hypothetical protein